MTSFAGRGADRARTGFAALTGLMLLGLVVASAVMSVDTGSDRFLERYLIAAFPLVAIAFCCWADDGRPGRFVAVGVAALVIVAAARVPVSGQLTGQGSADSPTLLAVSRLGGIVGLAEASMVAALVVSACAVLAMAAAMSRRVPTSALIGVTLSLFALVAVGAHVGRPARGPARPSRDLRRRRPAGSRRSTPVTCCSCRPRVAARTCRW